MTKVIIHSPEVPKKENLKKVYDVLNKIFNDDKLFYSSDEVKHLKNNKDNVFLS